METNIYRIKDICSIKSGKRIPLGMDFTTDRTNHPYIRARDIKGGTISTEDLVYIEESVFKKIKKYIIQSGDVAITIVGASVGDVAYATDVVDGYNLTENAVRLTDFNKDVNGKYVFYQLMQKQYRDYMQIVAGAAAQPKLGIYKIERIKFVLPTKQIQDKVVSAISAYDNLIEVNNKRIKVLEKMAENLYKEWFVRFRFPGHETTEFIDSRIGRIPNSFQVVKNKDVFDYYIGGGWGNDDEDKEFSVSAYVIRGTDFPRVKKGDVSTCPLRYHKASNYAARKLKDHDIIIEVSGGTSDQPVGRALIVTKDAIERLEGRVICASFCKLVRVNTKVISPLYFYYWMKFLYETRIIDRFQLQSTGIINFQFEFFFNKGDVILPPMELMKKFEAMIVPIMDQISTIAKGTENLIKQRDLLLPRLMSGKLEV